MAEEIDTPGEGQIRALVTIAGNPVLSTPNGGGRLDAALDSLEFMVSVDIYVNETTRHADVILPAPDPLQKSHYDLALLQLALRNVANYSPPVLPLDDGQPDEWEVLAKLALVAPGHGCRRRSRGRRRPRHPHARRHAVADEASPVHGREVDEVLDELAPRHGPERMLDLMLRTGPYDAARSTISIANPHGIDLGPLEPRLPDALRTPAGRSSWRRSRSWRTWPGSTPRSTSGPQTADNGPFVLVGRRHLRSNNSWMHNVNVLVKGKPRCTLQVHPDDAARLGLADGDPRRGRGRAPGRSRCRSRSPTGSCPAW